MLIFHEDTKADNALTMNADLVKQHAWKVIRKRIDELLAGGLNQTQVGIMAGVSRGTISSWVNDLKGGEKTTFRDMVQYAIGLGVDLVELIGREDYVDSDFDYVSKVKAKLGAGYSLEVDDTVEDLYAFRKGWLARIGNPEQMILLEVVGDSMRPTIENGDLVLVSIADEDREPHSGEIYAVRVDDELMVRRVLREPGHLVLAPDNRDSPHKPVLIDLKQEHGNVALVGKIRWLGRVFGQLAHAAPKVFFQMPKKGELKAASKAAERKASYGKGDEDGAEYNKNGSRTKSN